MQTITPALEAILKSKLQVVASGFRARLEVDEPDVIVPTPEPDVPGIVQYAFMNGGSIGAAKFSVPATEGNTILMVQFCRDPPASIGAPSDGGFTRIAEAHHHKHFHRAIAFDYHVVTNHEEDYTAPDPGEPTGNGLTYRASSTGHRCLIIEMNAQYAGIVETQDEVAGTSALDTGGAITPSAGVPSLIIGGSAGDGANSTTPYAGTTELIDVLAAGFAPYCYLGYDVELAPSGSYTIGATQSWQPYCGISAVFIALDPGEGGEGEGGGGIVSNSYRPKYVAIDKSLNLVADEATVELTNEGLALGWGPSSVFRTSARCRIYEWYGDEENAVLRFTGLIDNVVDGRNVLTVTLSMRDMMALLADGTFSTIGPQGADEVGAIRTVANGVYLNMEVSDIVSDILDRAGWPTDDRDLTETSYVLDEFIISDGASWADAIIGDEQLAGLVGYSAWADELGVFHFAPTSVSQNLTEPLAAVYTFRPSEDLVELEDSTDQYGLVTRIKVRGPLTTTTLTDTWRELWRTKKFTKPVGLWHDPTDAANLRVLDRSTKRLYKMRQSDRAVLSSVNIEPVVAHPLGLSGDPADSAVYWLLNAPWIFGVAGTNRVKKVRKSDNHVLASFDLPSGHISAIKVSSSYLYYTNLSTDRFYRISKSDGSAIANYSHTYNGNVQANPSGLMIDGSTLYLFWANGGSTARFLKCDESAPGTVTGVVKTAGTTLHGGEMDTVTHIDCYGDSDSLGLVAKFTLKTATSSTSEVFAEVVDSDLEDELGGLAHVANREHDTHPTDDDHQYLIRRMTLDLSVITNLAQATETAQRQLDILSERARMTDAGILGNPALQKFDPIGIIDPVTGLDEVKVIHTYRSVLDADSTYLGVLALLPVDALDDDPTDEGDADE